MFSFLVSQVTNINKMQFLQVDLEVVAAAVVILAVAAVVLVRNLDMEHLPVEVLVEEEDMEKGSKKVKDMLILLACRPKLKTNCVQSHFLRRIFR